MNINSGIYVPNDDRWPKHFRGMGIRIEDSVCVQETAPLTLTTEAVKEVSEAKRGQNHNSHSLICIDVGCRY